jgi:hypothetical protein
MNNGSLNVGCGRIIRNSNGENSLRYFSVKMSDCTVIVVEVLIIFHGVKLA